MTSQPFFVPAVLILLISLPLVLELVPRNRFYGIRTAKTLSDKRIWYRANRYGGWLIILASLVYLMVAELLPTAGAGDPDMGRWTIHLLAFLLPLLISLLLTGRYVKRL